MKLPYAHMLSKDLYLKMSSLSKYLPSRYLREQYRGAVNSLPSNTLVHYTKEDIFLKSKQ